MQFFISTANFKYSLIIGELTLSWLEEATDGEMVSSTLVATYLRQCTAHSTSESLILELHMIALAHSAQVR